MHLLKQSSTIAIFSFLFSVSTAQIRTCLDASDVTRPNTNVLQGAYNINYKWTPGTTLTISFIDGTDWQRQKVKQYAPGWCNYANLKFNFVDGRKDDADIRISFRPELGSCSQIGTVAKTIRPGEWTMNYGWIDSRTSEADIRGVVLHEFGHALGLLHEHMNPYGNIQWNREKVYAYYMSLGWSREKIEMNIFDRYSVGQTNNKYDPKSIMHYPVPKEHTLNGYAVGINNDLSPDDIELARELYPSNQTFPENNRTNVWANLQDLTIDYEVVQDGKLGMRIKQDFLVYNAENTNCTMGVYFYNADTDKPLRDKNQRYWASNGDVAAFVNFRPNYQNTQYTDLTLFIPYDELDLPGGEFRLKCFVALFDQSLKQISTSGYQYFTYRQGMSVHQIAIDKTFDDVAQEILVYPIFTIQNAKDVLCNAAVYFYDENGQLLRDYNSQYTSPDGYVTAYATFKPGYTSALYNSGRRDFWFRLPYSELHLTKGFYNLKFMVVLYDNQWKEIKRSEMTPFTFRQN